MNYKFSSFVTVTLDVTEIPGKNRVFLWTREPICWVNTDGVKQYVPAGIVSDGYSYPDFTASLIRGLPSNLPALFHDWQFWTGEAGSLWASNMNIYRAIIDVHGSRYTAVKVVAGLTLGSWRPWRRYAKERAEFGYAEMVRRHTATSEAEAIAIAQKGYV